MLRAAASRLPPFARHAELCISSCLLRPSSLRDHLEAVAHMTQLTSLTLLQVGDRVRHPGVRQPGARQPRKSEQSRLLHASFAAQQRCILNIRLASTGYSPQSVHALRCHAAEGASFSPFATHAVQSGGQWRRGVNSNAWADSTMPHPKPPRERTGIHAAALHRDHLAPCVSTPTPSTRTPGTPVFSCCPSRRPPTPACAAAAAPAPRRRPPCHVPPPTTWRP